MFPAITSTINNIILSLFGITTSLDNIVLYGVLLVMFARNLRNVRISLNIKQLAFVAIFLVALFYTAAFYPSNLKNFWTSAGDVLNPLYVFVFLTFSGFFVCLQLKDADIFLKEAEKWSIAVVILSALQYIITHINKIDDPQYMVFSYNMLFSVTILLLLAFRESKPRRWIFAVTGVAFIFVAGCRGALVSLLACLFIYLLFLSDFSLNKKMYIVFLAIIILPILYFQMNNILAFFARVLDGLNVESRTIKLALESSFLDDSGRNELLQEIFGNMKVIGYGLYGDRYFLEERYAHNLFAEFVCDFGFIFGTILCIALVVVIIKALRHAEYKWKLVVCALLSVGFFKLMFSGSFLNQEPGFYVLIGMCLNPDILKKKERIKSIYIRG